MPSCHCYSGRHECGQGSTENDIVAVPAARKEQTKKVKRRAAGERKILPLIIRITLTKLNPLSRTHAPAIAVPNSATAFFAAPKKLSLSASRTACTGLRSESSGSWGQEVSSRFEEKFLSQGHIPFDGAVSDLPSGAGLGTASWLPPISSRES